MELDAPLAKLRRQIAAGRKALAPRKEIDPAILERELLAAAPTSSISNAPIALAYAPTVTPACFNLRT